MINRPAIVAICLLPLTACMSVDEPGPPGKAEPLLDSAAVAALSTANAVTGGGEQTVEWGYRLAPGDRLRMRYTLVMANEPPVGPLYYEGEEEVLLEVERVNADGSTVITVTTLGQKQREKTGPEHPLVKSSYASRVPKYRAEIDRLGNVIGGDILKQSEEDRQAEKEAAQPGSGTRIISRLRRIQINTDELLIPLFGPNRLSIGQIYRDTVVEHRKATQYPIDSVTTDRPVPGEQKELKLGTPRQVDYQFRTIRALKVLGWVVHEGERYLRVVEEFEKGYSGDAFGRNSWRGRRDYLVRGDGAIVSAKTETVGLINRVPNGTSHGALELMRE